MKKTTTILLLALTYVYMVATPATTIATLSGKITDGIDGSPLIGVVVSVPALNARTVTDEDGNYTIPSLPSRIVTVQVSYIGHQTIIKQIDLSHTSKADFTMKESNAELDEVVVTGVTGAGLQKDSPIPITAISQHDLQGTSSTNIIDAIAKQPGISQITTGGGISKPVIRGLGYNRIVVVDDGVRQEGQQWGDEHGIEIDANSVDNVEVIKGPASLMYGSDAMAGVIIFNSDPTMPSGQMKATVSSEYQTNNGLFDYSLDFAGNKGGVVWNARYSDKMSHAYKNKYDGYVMNSQFSERALSGLIGINRDWGFSHLKLSYYHVTPSMVEGERDEAGQFTKPVVVNGEETEQVATNSDFKDYGHKLPYQQVYHYKVVWDNSIYVGNGQVKAIIGYQQNRREEFDDALNPNTPGLYLQLHTVTYDMRYQLNGIKEWKFNAGVNGMYQLNQNKGTEYLIPNYNLFDIGAFMTGSYSIDKLRLSGGIRMDNRHLHGVAMSDRFSQISRNFTGLTGSVGAVYDIDGGTRVRLNVARGFRAPNINEIAANGAHEGTFTYEVGNARLKPEYSWQIDAGLDYSSPIISAQLSLFANFISNYIFTNRMAGVITDDLPTYQYTQGNAQLLGGEASVDIHPMERLHFQNAFSYVNSVQPHQPAESKYLPFTPAPRITSELSYDIIRDGKLFNNTYVKAGLEWDLAQNHVYLEGGTETPTPSYALFDMSAGTDIIINKHLIATVVLTADNITDTAYQNHLSRLKYAPVNPATGRSGIFNMGRNFGIKILVPLTLK